MKDSGRIPANQGFGRWASVANQRPLYCQNMNYKPYNDHETT